ncbi:segregation and condensation protein B [Caldalkalibacillus uzonensis]|uniref:Segregation and condensation protein B n=1 Tax=Caldalkalibacillus uzonensis TaxID=353224 RepID=A0ABU0CS57_9BACI|nr:SMC-Scp complex subunit ScpB [Caldalkalibacillus uzonensis]MDQ0339179.1 segregation and condensation protein B [Caldalkalibacillus uzonensis]
MDRKQLLSVIEGLLFVAGDEGLEAKQIADVLEIRKEAVPQLIEEMKKQFKQQNRGIQVIEIAGSYQLTTRPEHAPYFEKLAYSPSHATLSQAALETLAIIAYKQPVTRAEVEEVRGVKSEKAINTLLNKSLIREVGRKEGTGRAILYGTTKEFLDYFGLNSLDDLPELPEDIDMDQVKEEANFLFSTPPSQMQEG